MVKIVVVKVGTVRSLSLATSWSWWWWVESRELVTDLPGVPPVWAAEI